MLEQKYIDAWQTVLNDITNAPELSRREQLEFEKMRFIEKTSRLSHFQLGGMLFNDED